MAARGGGRGHKVNPPGGLAMTGSVTTGVGTTPKHVFIPPDGNHVYCTLSGNSNLAQYVRNADGSLTPFAVRDIAMSNGPAFIASSPDGTGLFVSLAGSYAIKPITRNVATGVLSLGTSVYVDGSGATPYGGQYPQDLAVTPDGLFLYVACRFPSGMASVAMFSRNPSTNALTRLSPFGINTGSNFQSMGLALTQFDNAAFVYVANFSNNSISIFTRDTSTGQLAAHSTMPTIATGTASGACWMAIAPNAAGTADGFLYVCLDGTAQVACYTIETDGSLTLVGKYATGNGPFSIRISADNLYVYVGNSDGQTISQYTRNTSTGVLTPMVPAQVRCDPLYTITTGSAGPQTLALYGKTLFCTGSIAPNSISSLSVAP